MEETGSKGGRKGRTNVKAPTAAASKAPAAKPAATTKATPTTKPAARKTGAKPDAVPVKSGAKSGGPDRAELVRMAAYFRAERRGFAAGYEVEDWLAAEAEVAERLGSAPPATQAKSTPRKPSKG